MIQRHFLAILLLTALFYACTSSSGNNRTKNNSVQFNTIASRIEVPKGYVRTSAKSGTFAYYLRYLKLKPVEAKVYYYNGLPKINQHIHVAVIDLDVGSRDLQQCADAIMRLRGEYLFHEKRFGDIAFNFVSDGKPRYFLEYSSGDTTYSKFRKYMDYVFSYANTRSLYEQLKEVEIIDSMKIGDVFIQKRNPYGHAVIVVDIAVNQNTGEKIYLLAQSYMPAQSIHVLKNPNNTALTPWYEINHDSGIITPEWTFTNQDLRRF